MLRLLFGSRRIRSGARLRDMSGHFRSNTWDPILIIAQIIMMQSSFYLGFGLWIFFVDIIGTFDVSLDQVFTQSVSHFYFDYIYMDYCFIPCLILCALFASGLFVFDQNSFIKV